MSDEDRRIRSRAGAVACLMAALALAPVAQAAEGKAGEGRTRPRLCPQDAPEGVRLPQRAGCDIASERPRTDADGFRDLGNGVTLKLGGRAAVDVHTGR